MNELGDFSYLGVSRGAHCSASSVVQFAAQHCSSLCLQSEGDVFMAKNVTLLVVAAGPSSRPSLCKQSELQCFASESDHAAPQRATMLRLRERPCSAFFQQKKGIPKPPPRWRFRDTLRHLSDDAYSSPAKRGSHAGRSVGFCSKSFKVAAGTKRFSTTRRNMYSSNHSSVMMRWP